MIIDENMIPSTALFPEDPSVRSADLGGGWRLVGASRRGLGHEYEEKPREDDLQVRLLPGGGALIALADGLGSKDLSGFGARAAVRGAVAAPVESAWLAGDDAEQIFYAARAILNSVFVGALAAVQEASATLDGVAPEITLDDLETTLLVWLVLPRHAGQLLVAGAQIGDGALFARKPGTEGDAPRERWLTLLAQQVGMVDNEVLPLRIEALDAWQNAFFCIADLEADCLLAMTDGTADDLRPPHPTAEIPDPDPYLFIDEFGTLALRYTQESAPGPALLEFLGYRKRQSLDDRTVVLLFREGVR